MSILAADLRELVIRPVLERLERAVPGMASEAAELLLLGTAAQESQMGRYLRQHPEGPARGLYQMERVTFEDHMKWLLADRERDELLQAVLVWSSVVIPLGAQLAGNLYFATAIARVGYWRKPFRFKNGPVDRRDLAALWKRYWNTEAGAGTETQFLVNFERYVQQP